MATVTVKLEGLKGVLDTLKSLPPELVSKNGGPVRLAARKALVPMREDAKANVRSIVAEPNKDGLPSESTGLLEQNIVISRAKPRQNGERFLLRVRRKAYPKEGAGKTVTTPQVGRLLEYGTEKMVAHPWLRPAYEKNREGALHIFTAELNKGIARIVKKLARQNRAG